MDPQSIAHYRITSKLGEGGMGAVYRATDTKLARDVAIKVLPEAYANDPDRMARFVREAQLLASLNHPNIATIHGIEDRAIVMELVEGPTLADRIAQGALPLDEALAIARQIAEALEAAHEKGIIHRDLKPANVKVTPDGKVKVLDFGLAKLSDPTDAGEDPASALTVVRGHSPTMAGMIMGTAGYMAPEQARGMRVDKRADIWAFGVVLFEMLSGQEMFPGETVSDSLAAVLRADFDWAKLPATTPPAIRKLLRRSLERDRKKRLADIADARIEIEEALSSPEEAASVSVPLAGPPPGTGRLPWAVAVACLGVALVVSLVAWWRASRPVVYPLMRLSVDTGPESSLSGGLGGPRAILSPDGTRLVYLISGADGKERLATRSLDQKQPVVLAGTENAVSPFFSPDGQWVGFFADSKLKKVLVQGGGAVTLCDAPTARGGSWGDDGNIIAALGATSSLWRISSAGGLPQPAVELNTQKRDRSLRYPQVLPGSKAVLFVAGVTANNYEDATIEVHSFQTGQRKTLQSGGYFGRFVPSGHLLYMRQGVLFAAPLDLDRLELAGPAVPVLEDVTAYPGHGSAEFDFSQTGTSVYQAGKSVEQAWPIVWLENAGKTTPILAKPGAYYDMRFAPDGKRLAMVVMSSGKPDVWVYEWERDTMTRLTFAAGANFRPVWSPDGKHIAFRANENNGIYWIRSDGAGEPLRLTQSKNNESPASFSPDGKRLAFTEQAGATGVDIWTLPLEGSDSDNPKPGKPEPFLRTKFTEGFPAFSPDGRWMAYTSDESGIMEVYVRPFPGPGGKWQVSTGGGVMAVWSRNGRELFYRTLDHRIMMTPYSAKDASFAAGKSQLWAEARIRSGGTSTNFDLAPDGKRFAALMASDNAGATRPTHVTFLLNFFDELRRKAPVGK
ncbi:MAG: serine/threonine-protein kinase [Acidobacteria bacterium]|nr:serine/threonine-protein kinase [Acidobacteriota bacterium]